MRSLLGFLAIVLLTACAPYPYGHGYGGNAGYGGGSWSIPPGAYRDSCRGIRTDGWLLKATCRQNDGSWRSTALDMRGCDRSVVNDDGRLRCGGSGGSSNIPRGSYARSCTDIRVRNGMLRCDCRSNDGRWYRNEVAVTACPRFANYNGRLGCER